MTVKSTGLKFGSQPLLSGQVWPGSEGCGGINVTHNMTGSNEKYYSFTFGPRSTTFIAGVLVFTVPTQGFTMEAKYSVSDLLAFKVNIFSSYLFIY